MWLAGQPPPEPGCSSPLYEDELVLVVHPGHDFAASGQIRMAQMATEHLILFDRVSSYRELTSSIFRQAGIEPRGYLEVDNIDAAKRIGRAAARDRAATPHLCAAGDRWRASLSRDRLGHARRATPDRGRSTARYRGALRRGGRLPPDAR